MIYAFLWYLTITLLGLLALPLVYRLLPFLPDRGYSLAKTVGLLLVGYLFWFLGSLGFLHNDVPGFFIAAAMVLALGSLWLRREGLEELSAWLRAHKRPFLAVELFFLIAFFGWLWVRSYSPDIQHFEKPMDFMFLNSILRSPAFPPHDAWLSGHAISYYYFGYLLSASLARVTATPPGIAFNLALSLIFALTAVGALGVVMNLVAYFRKGQPKTKKEKPADLLAAFWPGLLGPLFVALMGNYYGALELAHNSGWFAELEIPALRYDFGQVEDLSQVGSLADFEQPPGIRSDPVNFWEWLDLKLLNTPPVRVSENPWVLGNWFFAARVLHDRNLVGAETEAIDEVPIFSFQLGDLHPHMMALPFVVLMAAVAFDWLLWARETGGKYNEETGFFWPPWPRLLFTGIALGALAFLNTWDFPIYWFLTTAALALGLGSVWGWRELVRRWRYWALLSGLLLVLGIILYFPFYVTLQSQARGILPNVIYPTKFRQMFVMFGPLLVGVCVFMFWAVARGRKQLDSRAALIAGLGILLLLALPIVAIVLVAGSGFGAIPALSGLDAVITGAIYPLSRPEAAALIWQRRLVDSLSSIVPAVLIGLVAGLAVGALRREKSEVEIPEINLRSPVVLMLFAMILTGALLLIGPEFVYLRDNFGTRMNTLFKFYLQVWVLWALASAAGFWVLMDLAGRAARTVVAALMSAAVLLGLIYPIGTFLAKSNGLQNAQTLDGMAYFANAFPDDWAVIQWLDQNAGPQDVILEGTRGAYWLEGRSSRISMATGLPTVMGWSNHEGQWRGSYFAQVAGRESDIRLIYEARDWETAEALLNQYGVDYVIVSPLEREWYDVFEFKFDRFMDRVFQQGTVTVYAVP